MWKEYSIGYVKHNRSGSISIMVSALISALFLSLLGSLFFNFGAYEKERAILENNMEALEPTLLTAFTCMVLFLVSLSLILIIHNAFALSMHARIHQFGIFSSIGATPGQILACLLQEAAILCTGPIFVGTLLGHGMSFGIIKVMNLLARDVAGRHEAVWRFDLGSFMLTIVAAGITVLASAWIPARKLSKMTPLEAIRNPGVVSLKKKTRTATVSLTLSFLGFSLMLSFFTLATISTNYTYFEKYQDAWDLMVATQENGKGEILSDVVEQMREIQGVEDCMLYQKEPFICELQENQISDEVNSLGGLGAFAGEGVTEKDENWQVKSVAIVLDDTGFENYCRQLGVEPSFEKTIVYNQIWDSEHSNFRYRMFIPYVKQEMGTISLKRSREDAQSVEIPVLAYTEKLPNLREGYEDYALVQIMSVSLWNSISGQISKQTDVDKIEADNCYIRILAKQDKNRDQMQKLEMEVSAIMEQIKQTEQFTFTLENRLEEKETNDSLIWGYQIVLGGFCIILAAIGISNVFTNTLGMVQQRKRELAQYMSVGMTPKQMRNMFGREVLIITGKPILIMLPITTVCVAFMIRASYLNPWEFIIRAPFIPIFLFAGIVFFFVTFAYYLGAKKIKTCSLSQMLRDDTLL